MKDKTEDFDEQYTTPENVQKCIDNAFRLYDDALKTSTPTQAALIELGIEELIKGLLVLVKTPEFKKLSSSEISNIKVILNGKNNEFIKYLQQYKISDFKTRYHEKKLNTIQFILENAREFYLNNPDKIAPLLDIILDILKEYISKSGEEPVKILDTGFSFLDGIDIKNLYQIKESGFYVDFVNGEVIEPKDVLFHLDGIRALFCIIYLALNMFLNALDSPNALHSDTDLEKMLDKLFSMLPDCEKKI